MNYIKEINEFYNQIELNPLSSSAIVLWHTLMHINNKARWKEQFTVAATVLRMKSGLKDSSFKRARTELVEKGYLHVQSRDGNQAAVYQMISLLFDSDFRVEQRLESNIEHDANSDIENNDDGAKWNHITGDCVNHSKDCPERSQNPEISRAQHTKQISQYSSSYNHNHSMNPGCDQTMDHNENHTANHSLDHNLDHSADPLIKHKHKLKQNNTTTTTSAAAFYQENFGAINPYVTGELAKWVNDFGEAFVLEALQRALERNKASWGYAKGILQAWVKKGFFSVEEIQAEEMAFKNQKSKTQYRNFRPRKQEVIPDWFKDREQQQQQTQVKPQKQDHTEVTEIADLLANYKKNKTTLGMAQC